MQMQNKLRFLMTCCCNITANCSRKQLPQEAGFVPTIGLRSETGTTFRRISNKLTSTPSGQVIVNPSQCTINRMVAARVVPAADRGPARTMAGLPSGWHGQNSYKTACVKKGRRAHQWSL